MSRAARAVIDLSALRHNLQRVREAAPGRQVFAIIKANGYGHGMVPVAAALSEADGFGVASLEEAMTLRGAGITHPILLLEGFFGGDELAMIRRHQLQIAVHHPAQLDALEALEATELLPLTVWLKVDTGMHRLGFDPEQAPAAWQRLRTFPAVAQPPGLMTHLACADDLADPATPQQLERFAQLLPGEAAQRSIANSSAILCWPAAHGDMVRPGIMLYGASPMLGEPGAKYDLRPVMSLETALIAVKHCRRGDAVGYGGAWVCPEDMPIGVAAIGYGDGYPRHAPSGTPVLVNGGRVPLIGRVSMDMICLDLRSQPEARPGDRVELWGENLPAEEIAEAAGTITYELFCQVTSRVRREYLNG